MSSRLRRATLAADGAPEDRWPRDGTDHFLASVRQLLASSDQGARLARREIPVAFEQLLQWAACFAVLRIGLALALYGWQGAPTARVPGEVYVALLLGLGGVGVLLLFGGVREARSTALGTLLVLLAASFSQRFLIGIENPAFGLVLRAVSAVPIEAFFAAAAWRLALVFPATASGHAIQRFGRAMLTVSASLAVLLLIANVAEQAFLDIGWLEFFRRHNPGRSVFWPLLTVIAAPSLPVIYWKARSVHVDDQARVRRFTLGLLIGLVPATAMLSGVILVPAIDRHIEAHFAAYSFVFYSGLLFAALICGYAVAARRVLPVRLMLRDALLASLTRGALVGTVLLPLIWLAGRVRQDSDLSVGTFVAQTSVLFAIALLLVGGALLFVRPQVLGLLERAFERKSQSAASAVALAAGRIRTAIGLREMSQAVQRGMQQAFGVSDARVCVGNLDAQTLEEVGATTSALRFRRDGALTSLLELETNPLAVGGARAANCCHLLPLAERSALAGQNIELVCPIPNTSGRLLGLVLLGRRASERDYSDHEVELASSLCATAGIALETRFLVRGDSRDQHTVASECGTCGLLQPSDARQCACGGTDLTEARIPLVVAGRYQALRRAGAGGMGVVYMGQDQTLGRTVALKAMPAVSREGAERLAGEARMMAGVSHRHIAHVYGLEFWRDVPILVMEWMEGGTLADRIKKGMSFDEASVEALRSDLGSALRYLHSCGILHRDIKPSNIGFRESGEAVLLDFGIAVHNDARDAAPIAGTLGYLSPDVRAGKPQTPESDWWALRRSLEELS